MILTSFFIILSIVLLLLGIYYLFQNKKKFVIGSKDLVLIFLHFINEILYFIFINISFQAPTKEISIIFWNISIILRIFKISIPNAILSYVLLKSKLKISPLYIFAFLGGITGTYLLFTNSFQIVNMNHNFIFILKDDLFFIFYLFFNGFAVLNSLFTQLRGYKRISFKKMKNATIYLSIQYNVNIIIYYLFLLYPDILIVRYLYLISLLFLITVEIFILIARFDLFVVVTNKIYDFIIFHRSGVLLFSYNLEKDEEIDDSVLKGSILIGINHILSNFINKKDMLNLIKMRNGDIIFEYNNQCGYALLVIVDHKNKLIEKAVQLYIEQFTKQYKTLLSDINKNSQLIDTSKFKKAKNILYDYFKPFMNT